MHQALALLLLMALPATTLPAVAQTPLTAPEFDSYATGKTLTYSFRGEVFGTEQYLANRRVRWAFTGKECRDGYWYEDAGLICFVYEHDPTAQCWSFWHDDAGLHARFNDDPQGTELSEVEQSTVPLICAGPDVGA
ncbi:MAG: hypothetical protein Q8P60_06220 [Pseudorhodobacter sp.]|nr:hypothetical protein [Pseudorhodobacter sp.]